MFEDLSGEVLATRAEREDTGHTANQRGARCRRAVRCRLGCGTFRR